MLRTMPRGMPGQLISSGAAVLPPIPRSSPQGFHGRTWGAVLLVSLLIAHFDFTAADELQCPSAETVLSHGAGQGVFLGRTSDGKLTNCTAVIGGPGYTTTLSSITVDLDPGACRG